MTNETYTEIIEVTAPLYALLQGEPLELRTNVEVLRKQDRYYSDPLYRIKEIIEEGPNESRNDGFVI